MVKTKGSYVVPKCSIIPPDFEFPSKTTFGCCLRQEGEKRHLQKKATGRNKRPRRRRPWQGWKLSPKLVLTLLGYIAGLRKIDYRKHRKQNELKRAMQPYHQIIFTGYKSDLQYYFSRIFLWVNFLTLYLMQQKNTKPKGK